MDIGTSVMERDHKQESNKSLEVNKVQFHPDSEVTESINRVLHYAEQNGNGTAFKDSFNMH